MTLDRPPTDRYPGSFRKRKVDARARLVDGKWLRPERRIGTSHQRTEASSTDARARVEDPHAEKISLATRDNPSSERVIDVDRLGVRYGDFDAVQNLSFHVERGELYALLGTNGAGKTSALEVIEGHRKPSSGSVRVFGRSPSDRRKVRPRMGIMLQESGFAADLTVTQTVRVLGRLTRRTDSVERIVSTVDLTHKADAKVSQLSGGFSSARSTAS